MKMKRMFRMAIDCLYIYSLNILKMENMKAAKKPT